MSAWVVSDNHINVLINYALNQNRETVSAYFNDEHVTIGEKNAENLGQILLDENYRSVNYRYKKSDKAGRFKFIRNFFAREEKVQIIKHCDCLNYQSCESENWKETLAKKLLDAIRNNAISNLPGYDDAEWGVD